MVLGNALKVINVAVDSYFDLGLAGVLTEMRTNTLDKIIMAT